MHDVRKHVAHHWPHCKLHKPIEACVEMTECWEEHEALQHIELIQRKKLQTHVCANAVAHQNEPRVLSMAQRQLFHESSLVLNLILQ